MFSKSNSLKRVLYGGLCVTTALILSYFIFPLGGIRREVSSLNLDTKCNIERRFVKDSFYCDTSTDNSPQCNDIGSSATAELRIPPTALPNQATLRFNSIGELDTFLKSAPTGNFKIGKVLRELNTVQVLFDDSNARLPDSFLLDPKIGFNYPVRLPSNADNENSTVSTRSSANVPFEDTALAFMGVPADNREWGRGVIVAILDTGVGRHPSLAGVPIQYFDMIGDGAFSASVQGHGTAVSSIIAGQTPDAPGVAPKVSLQSYRVLDDAGTGDALTLAEAVVQAVKNKAQIINMSLGSYDDSPVLRDAVAYAQKYGVVVVASVGNDARDTVTYPSAYEGVIAVGAVDASEQPASFSNSGAVALSAPGVGIYSAWGENELASVSGSSFSAPYVSGAIAGIASIHRSLTPKYIAQLLIQKANDVGSPGVDSQLGAGVINVGRALNYKQAINDVAVADFYLDLKKSTVEGVPLSVSVQNRGTFSASNIQLKIDLGDGTGIRYFSIGNLAPDGVGARTLFIPLNKFTSTTGIVVNARADSNESASDSSPENNTRTSRLRIIEKDTSDTTKE